MRIFDILAVCGLFEGSKAAFDTDVKMIMSILKNPAAPNVIEEHKEFCYTLESIDLDVWRKCYDPCKEEGGKERECENKCLQVNFVVDGEPDENSLAAFQKWQDDYMQCFKHIDIEKVAAAIAKAEYQNKEL